MTSYQKLKKQNADLEKTIYRLLTEPEFLMTEIIRLNMATELNKRVMLGEHASPSGEVNFSSLLSALNPDK